MKICVLFVLTSLLFTAQSFAADKQPIKSKEAVKKVSLDDDSQFAKHKVKTKVTSLNLFKGLPPQLKVLKKGMFIVFKKTTKESHRTIILKAKLMRSGSALFFQSSF